MRTRQKLTAAGALTLATCSIGGGAFVTAHAMADGTAPPKGTLTVVSMTSDSNGAVKCVYDDVDLPALTATPSSGAVIDGLTRTPPSSTVTSTRSCCRRTTN